MIDFTCDLEIQESIKGNVLPFLNLPGIALVSKQESDHDYHVQAETTEVLSMCPHCSSDKIRRFGTKDQVFMDVPTHGKRVGIYLKRKRYQCKACNKTPFEPLPQMDGRRLCTNRLKEYIQRRSMRVTFTSLADDIGLDEKTIRNIFRDHVAELEAKYQFDTPRWLGIDEVHLNRTMRCVITDIEERTLVDMLPTRTKKAVISAFQGMDGKDQVELVSMDMWRPYKDAATLVFPNAQIVVDKFHVVKMANESLEKIRKATRADLTTKQKRALINDRYVLLKRRHRLTDKEAFKLSGWTLNYPLLAEGYEMKEAFYDVWNADTQAEAQEAYYAWLRQISPEMKIYFNDLIRAVGNWHDEIFSYFDNRITNAYTESLNNLIKVMHKLGRGYSFEALRAKMLYTEGLHKVKRPKFEKRVKAPADGVFIAEYCSPDYSPTKTPAGRERLKPEELIYSGVSISTLMYKLELDEI